MSTILSLSAIKKILNEQVINDIQLIEASTNQTKLSFYTPEKKHIESEVFDDNELENVIDFILKSKSNLSLGC